MSCDYQTLDGFLQGRCRNSRKLENHTYARRVGTTIAIWLHNTPIINAMADGSWRFGTGGWESDVTFRRMKRWSPHEIGRRLTRSRGIFFWHVGCLVDFTSGDTWYLVDGEYKLHSAGLANVILEPPAPPKPEPKPVPLKLGFENHRNIITERIEA